MLRTGGRPHRHHNSRGGIKRFLTKGACESTGPAGALRGTATQLTEKYMQLAKESLLRREDMRAEDCLQHAEHYRRLSGATRVAEQTNQTQKASQDTVLYPPEETIPDKEEIKIEDGEQIKDPQDMLPAFVVEDSAQSQPTAVNATKEDNEKAPKKRMRTQKNVLANKSSEDSASEETSTIQVKRRTRRKKEEPTTT